MSAKKSYGLHVIGVCVSYIGYRRSTLADGCVCVPLSVTSATLQPVDFDRRMCVCVPLSVTSATAGRLWQTDVDVRPFVSYIGYTTAGRL